MNINARSVVVLLGSDAAGANNLRCSWERKKVGEGEGLRGEVLLLEGAEEEGVKTALTKEAHG